MDYVCDRDRGCGLFRSFVCMAVSLLVGLQVYAFFWGPQDSIDGSLGEVKYVVMQLTRGLSEVNRKHDRLQSEIERISSALPAVAAAAGRAKDVLEPTLRKGYRLGIDMRDYDRQLVDYALETAGAKIVDTGDTIEHVVYESPVSWMLHALSTWLCRECLGARAMIHPGSLPGECWAFKGARGEATIRLPGAVRVSGVSIEHIPAHISPTREISSAPRLFQIEGLEYRSDMYPHDFGSFEYNKDGKPIQYFEILHPSSKAYSLVKIRVLSNWGHSVYTCVYRVRVHGELETAKSGIKTMDDELRIENEDEITEETLDVRGKCSRSDWEWERHNYVLGVDAFWLMKKLGFAMRT